MQTCDVVVVGAGIAGVAAAQEIARYASVTVIEAEPAAPVHTTGRSAAICLPTYGPPIVRQLTQASLHRFREVEETWDTPRLLSPRDVLYIAGEAGLADLAALESLGLSTVSVTQAQELFPALRAEAVHGAVLDTSGSDVDVLALHQAYVRALRARGGRLALGSPLRSLTPSEHGWVVVTGDGTWSCGTVVNAAGAWADEIARLAGQPTLGLQPFKRSAFISPVDVPDGFLSWPFVMDAGERFYAKPEGDALLGSPAEETPEPAADARPDELEIARALEALRELTTFPLRSVRTAWGGQRTFSPDRAPILGEADQGSGFFWCAGLGGYGIQMAPALGRLAGQLYTGCVPDAEWSDELLSGIQPHRLLALSS